MKPKAPSLWVKLRLSEGGELGPGKIALLKNVREHKSIAAAARAMGMSYRRAWLLTDAVNRTFAEPVFATKLGGKGGGHAQLTDFGRSLVDLYRRMERRTELEFGDDIRKLEAALAPSGAVES